MKNEPSLPHISRERKSAAWEWLKKLALEDRVPEAAAALIAWETERMENEKLLHTMKMVKQYHSVCKETYGPRPSRYQKGVLQGLECAIALLPNAALSNISPEEKR